MKRGLVMLSSLSAHRGKTLFPMIAVGSLFVCTALRGQVQKVEPLHTGWHDELNETAIHDWTWQPTRGRADLSAPKEGVLRLTLGDKSQEDHIGKDTYYWATCARYATVDLDRYPLMAVRVLKVKGRGDSWWDVKVNDYKGGTVHGPDIGGTLKRGRKSGLLFLDLTENGKLTGKKQIRLRLNVAGMKQGAYADYSYVRFIERKDRQRLEQNPDSQKVLP